ncbi:exlusion protein FxsA [Chromatium weissei]|nr:exlusion protein FxsA [Chromatium weissei]
MALFLLLLIGLPLLELYLLIRASAVIGVFSTIGIAIFTALLGTLLMRHQGLSVLRRIQTALNRGELPAQELLDGAVLLIAGCFLLLPGFLTDSVGLLLLTPPLRHWFIRRISPILPVMRQPHATQAPSARIIEGEWRRDD